MSWHVGFRKTLLKMGKWRFGVGRRVKGTTGIIALLIYGMLYFMWYMILALLWMMYGVMWLCFVFPIKEIARLRKKKTQSNISNVSKVNSNDKIYSSIDSIDG